MRRLSYLLFVFIFVGTAAAQSADCPAIVTEALDAIDQICSDLGRNEACYGNVNVTAQPAADAVDFTFSAAGDVVSISDIESMTLSALNEASGEWGVALLSAQANLPNTLPGQNVAVLLFGDAELSDAQNNMQSFYFRAGIGESGCAGVPASGIMIQTPEDAGEVELVINDVEIRLGSTIFLNAEAGDTMTVALLEGHAEVTAFEETQILEPGYQLSVPVDENLTASGAPSEPEEMPEIYSAPASLANVSGNEPAAEATAEATAAVDWLNLDLTSGMYSVTTTFGEDCGAGLAGLSMTDSLELNFESGSEGIVVSDDTFEEVIYAPTGNPNEFSMDMEVEGDTMRFVMTYISSGRFDVILNMSMEGEPCTVYYEYTLAE